ncbi:phage portal protein [Brevundimonas sp.]|uniref:phage portal protein n=1 Tax=Brevundimonas sp. TaxID=1871086 RepID=UPI002D2ACF8F|nr:phage portal protein [Brevundimonas sp.]HYC66650.1 phage portal protein [Brevundimonas sp.]
MATQVQPRKPGIVARAAMAIVKAANLASVAESRGWFRVYESYQGAWQQNVTIDRNLVLSFHAVYACMTLIASDVAKLRVKLVKQDAGIWTEADSPAYSPVLRKPNPWQTRIQFWEGWMLSKLMRGNAYVLKRRDARNVVVALYVLDPNRVTPMVADDGSVFYQLQTDNLAGMPADVLVPAREIIHDRMNCLFHPLVGTSPIYASGLAAMQGMNILDSSAAFFGNRSQPGGVLTAPGSIADETATRLKETWETNFSGENAGRVAVLGDGLKYERMAMSAEESQLIEQLKWSAEVVCSTFHVPPYKIGIGQMPTYNNIQALNVEYYSQCLQSLIEAAELCLDEGLECPAGTGTEFDTENLLRMDSVTQMQVLKEGAGILKIDEMRAKLDKGPTEGGDAVYLQQQNYSLAALARRDAGADPFGTEEPAPAQADPANDNEAELQAARAMIALTKGLSHVRR